MGRAFRARDVDLDVVGNGRLEVSEPLPLRQMFVSMMRVLFIHSLISDLRESGRLVLMRVLFPLQGLQHL